MTFSIEKKGPGQVGLEPEICRHYAWDIQLINESHVALCDVSFSFTSPGQNNAGIGRKTQNEFFRGLLAPWGFGEHPKTHTFLESTCPD